MRCHDFITVLHNQYDIILTAIKIVTKRNMKKLVKTSTLSFFE